ncbi:branched-chain amino acid ABC transporter ATP-binding protein/permease [Bordetella bronchiseptica]|uniref:branched-chain amino acid ABC transporter ATP-binding protein/permease n=1 Tax=Bordetella bronchiseptica TaxID=518 RepID=UPI000444AB51|nr:branched-chain amino acid ABC transporter ATP-binding protein/permease [Bordetella bronchiseptica]KDB78134.1 branched-chain amino acid ABC transporter, permease protein [Bordetella bronchiseptica CARE970018BB]KDC44036.1 branched-chain amino acid ABC transporter, permease protein [Bordetella bronchiseptica M435/02/3]KDC44302.1 branched-chain amino acid ABC transporter, permease protein [Bordetella bronchiseptica M85/00/2]KDC92250.1 branched-chain amino acid ABC transporter, permease protein [
MKLLGQLLTNSWTLGVLAIALAVGAGHADTGTVQMWSFVIINILLAQGINLLTGINGQISLGHAGFFAIGAYVSAIALKSWGVPFPVALAMATIVASGVGFLLAGPAGRVREFYLAMMSLGFGLIVYELARELRGVTGGVMGMRGIPSSQIGTLQIFGWSIDTVAYFRILLAVLLVVMLMLRNFVKSHYGRAFYAVHVSEIAAGSLGISQAAVKRAAYAISGGLAGLAGGFYAHMIGYLTPESFGLMRSIEILVMSIVGGLGSLAGQVYGAVLFTYLPQKLQAFNDYQYIVYGLILVFIFTLLPRGLAGLLGTQTRYSKYDQLRRAVAGQPAAPLGERPPHARREAAQPLIRVEQVVMEFAGLRALAGVSLDLHAGSITALVGPNGSGKSTLVNVVSGIYRPTSGRVLYKGQDIAGWPSHKVAQAGITRTFQDPRNVPSFTVRENILMGAHRRYRHGALAAAINTAGARREEAAFLRQVDALMQAAGLSEHADAIMSELPYGIQRLAEVARALASDPELLLLDEPAAGLSELESGHLIGLVRLARDHGVAVMVIDHHMDFLAELAEDVVVFEAGDEIYRGDMDGMRADPAVIQAYLGAQEPAHA